MRLHKAVLASVAAWLVYTTAIGAQSPRTQSPTAGPVTFYRDALPILQKSCQSCHRPGQVAPMSLLTYQESRPWARSIKNKVVEKEMPPWSADPRYGHFANDRSLSQHDIETLSAWVDGGAIEGNRADAPPPVHFPDGWQIQPDIIVEVPPFDIPAKGVVETMTVTIPSGFTKDTWVTSIEIRPSAPVATHHICFSIARHVDGDRHGVPTRDNPPERDANWNEIPKGDSAAGRGPRKIFGTGNDSCYLPGQQPMSFTRTNSAKLVPAGADFRLNLHYTPSGEAVTDRAQIGFTVAKQPPTRRFVTVVPQPTDGTDAKHFRIPAGDPNYESGFEGTFLVDAELAWMMPHMHYRGKDMKYTLVYPDGRSETVLFVPRYDFNWQLGYEPATPIKIPKGTKIVAVAHHDNSANNKSNPDPTKDVFFGNQTWEEMMNPWFGIVVPANVDPAKVIKSRADLTSDGA